MRLANRAAATAGGEQQVRLESGQRSLTTLVLAAMGASLIAVMSWVSVPLAPVPITLQTLGVLVVAGLLGHRWGAVSVVVFLLIGTAGLPVFHGGSSGPGVVAGPTGGYLIGFVLAAFVMGWFAGHARRLQGRKSLVLLAGGALLATACVYLVGIPWLSAVTGLGLREALGPGLLPFIPGDLLKAALAVALVRAIDRALLFR
jgi:biotin transport system substrate-specific component